MKRVFRIVATIFFSLLVVIFGSSLGAFFAIHNKIVPGVNYSGRDLSLLSKPEAIEVVGRYLDEYEKNDLVLTSNNFSKLYPLSDLGMQYERNEPIDKAFLIGREGSILNRAKLVIQSLVYGHRLNPEVHVDDVRWNDFLASLGRLVNQTGEPSHYTLVEDTIIPVAGKAGTMIDKESLRRVIVDSVGKFEYPEIAIPMTTDFEVLTLAELQSASGMVQQIIDREVVVSYGKQTWKFSAEGKLASIVPRKNTQDNSVYFDYIDAPLQTFLNAISAEVNRPPQDGELEVQDLKVTKFTPPISGLTVKTDETFPLLKTAFQEPFGGSVKLIVDEVAGAGLANEYGIIELIGEGDTKFIGSSAGRIHNIGLAASRISGTLIPPGEEFSFNATVGEISSRTGYDQAYIIAERRTQLGTGGGVCQVSTTVYRAALYAGFEILARTPHAYRVGYYEPAGLDSTVYSPSPDLRFKNNTSRYALLWSIFNPEKSTLMFQVYGTNDGRVVEVSVPVISGGGAPPAPLYIEDPSLAPGVTKQTDFASWGAYATVTRKVTRNGEALIDEVIKSSYSPWQAVFMVGPSEDD